MHANFSTANGFNLSDPELYTGNHLKGDFVRSNDLLKHINVYRTWYSRDDYSMLFGLKGAIKEIAETEHSDEHEAPRKVTWRFNPSRELVGITREEAGSLEILTLTPSRKNLQQAKFVRYIHDECIGRTVSFYDSYLKCVRIEDLSPGREPKVTLLDYRYENVKYAIRNNRIVSRIDRINNQHEQSKCVTHFDDHYNVTSAVATDQKNPSVVLYETLYNYNTEGNISDIKYIRYKGSRIFAENYSRTYTFGYDADGYLTSMSGFGATRYFYDDHKNLIYSQQHDLANELSFELQSNHRYDAIGNWIQKKTTFVGFNRGVRRHIYKKECNRVIDYY